MTEMVMDSAQSSDIATPTNVSSSATETTSNNVESSERTFTQAELNKIAAKVRHETRDEYYNRGKQEALAEIERNKQNQAQPQSESSMGGMQQMTPEQIDKLIEQKVNESKNLEYSKQIVNDFVGKMVAAKDKYPDFEETVAQLNLPAIPHIVQWANGMDNTADVIYDIGKNPAKFANLLMLSQTAPLLAQREMQKLSDSIKKNQEAKTQPNAKEPLSQIKPSLAGTDNGKKTVSDLRKQSWLKG